MQLAEEDLLGDALYVSSMENNLDHQIVVIAAKMYYNTKFDGIILCLCGAVYFYCHYMLYAWIAETRERHWVSSSVAFSL